MVATHTKRTATTSPITSIPNSAAYTATEHWTGGLHWTHYVPTEPRPGAKTLVLVHGASHNEYVWTLGADPWVGSFTALGHEVITVSLSGHHPSKGNVTFQTLHRYVNDVHTPLEVLGLADEAVVIIGHSMGGIVAQKALARYPHLAGCVVLDCVALHRALDTYLPVMQRLFRHHPRTALAAMVSPAALFGSDPLVRELLVGEDADDALVAALRLHLGGETAVATPTMLIAKFRGRQPLDGQRLCFVSAQRSAFYPTSVVEASAREYGARCVVVDGPHNLMLVPSSALPAAQAVEAFLGSLKPDHAPQHVEEARR